MARKRKPIQKATASSAATATQRIAVFSPSEGSHTHTRYYVFVPVFTDSCDIGCYEFHSCGDSLRGQGVTWIASVCTGDLPAQRFVWLLWRRGVCP